MSSSGRVQGNDYIKKYLLSKLHLTYHPLACPELIISFSLFPVSTPSCTTRRLIIMFILPIIIIKSKLQRRPVCSLHRLWLDNRCTTDYRLTKYSISKYTVYNGLKVTKGRVWVSQCDLLRKRTNILLALTILVCFFHFIASTAAMT